MVRSPRRPRARHTRTGVGVPHQIGFDLGDGGVLGLMPESGIRKLLATHLSRSRRRAHGIPRAELHLLVDDPGCERLRASPPPPLTTLTVSPAVLR